MLHVQLIKRFQTIFNKKKKKKKNVNEVIKGPIFVFSWQYSQIQEYILWVVVYAYGFRVRHMNC